MVAVDYDVRALDASARAAAEFWKRFAPMAEELAIQGVRRHFETESSPDGAKWAPLKDSTFRISVLQAIKKLGGKAAFPIVKTNEYGGATAYARTPVAGMQKSAVVRRTKKAHKILQDTRRLYGSIWSARRRSKRAAPRRGRAPAPFIVWRWRSAFVLFERRAWRESAVCPLSRKNCSTRRGRPPSGWPNG